MLIIFSCAYLPSVYPLSENVSFAPFLMRILVCFFKELCFIIKHNLVSHSLENKIQTLLLNIEDFLWSGPSWPF